MVANDQHEKFESCSLCKLKFNQNDMLNFEGRWVCGGCKNRYVQMLREGVAVASLDGVGRDKKRLVCTYGAVLPERCIKCNQPAHHHRITRKLTWMHPAYSLILLVFFICMTRYFILGLFLFFFIAIFAKKKATIEISLCEKHRNRRRIMLTISWSLAAISIALLFYSIYSSATPIIFITIFLLIFTLLFVLFGTHLISATKMNEDGVWLRGVCTAFRDEFPEWKG